MSQDGGAHRALRRLGGEAYAAQALPAIRGSLAASSGRSLMEVLKEPRFLRVLGIGVVLAVLQQWCGINVIFNYARKIFASAGYAVSDTLFNIVITGVVNCAFTLLALDTVERWGRRRLMLLGCSGLTVTWRWPPPRCGPPAFC